MAAKTDGIISDSDIQKNLERHNLALSTIGSIVTRTAAGCTGTGTHGSGSGSDTSISARSERSAEISIAAHGAWSTTISTSAFLYPNSLIRPCARTREYRAADRVY